MAMTADAMIAMNILLLPECVLVRGALVMLETKPERSIGPVQQRLGQKKQCRETLWR